jgi:hypothetical protein
MKEDLILITVTTSKAEYNKFCLYTASKIVGRLAWISVFKNALIWVVSFMFIMSLVRFLSNEVSVNYFYIILSFTAILFLYIGLSKIFESLIMKRYQPYEEGIILGEKKYRIDKNGIFEKNKFGDSFYSWGAVDRIDNNGGSVYIFVDNVLALIFSEDSIENDQDFLNKVYFFKNINNKEEE